MNNPELNIALGNLPVSKSEVDTVLDKSDSITVDGSSVEDSLFPHLNKASYARKRLNAINLAELKLTDEHRDDGLRVAIGTLLQPFTSKEIELNKDLNLVMCENYASLNNPDDKRLSEEEVKEKIIVSARQTGKPVLNSLFFDQAMEALYLTKREVPQIHNNNSTVHESGLPTDK